MDYNSLLKQEIEVTELRLSSKIRDIDDMFEHCHLGQLVATDTGF